MAESELPNERKARKTGSGRLGVEAAGVLVISGGLVGLVAAYLLWGVASLFGVFFALLAMLLLVFSVVQVIAGIRVMQRVDAGRRLANWLLISSAVLLLIGLYKEPFACILGLALDAFAFLALRENAGHFERAEE
jgi:hypothetical protein